MAYIKVNHSQMETAASAIDGYVSNHKAKMRMIDSEMSNLISYWSGEDYQSVKTQWEEMKSKDSTSEKMVKAMENHAKFLRYAAGKYKEAQSRAVNRADNLPKW